MPTDDTSNKTPAGIYEHWCEHAGCKKWGGFGFSAGKSAPMRWWCWAHYPYKPNANGSLSS
ncbi:hypothetical protein [Shinella sp.]|uniref:hypothetical protein n=1 Tax=Shinella sp. TaxID=1870904 RepID=UPI0029B4292F|nr:hypothetical protein [Shinella sp.]MDX3973322.1 hypothetical protein [Shinella sp.]